jgi:hypothetical protein
MARRNGSGNGNRLPTGVARHELTAEQAAVVAGLATGQTFADAASAAGVERSLVYRWLGSLPAFVAAANRVRSELRESTLSKVQVLAPLAVETVKEALTSPDSPPPLKLRAVAIILRLVTMEPVGAVDAESIEAEFKRRGVREFFADAIGPFGNIEQ